MEQDPRELNDHDLLIRVMTLVELMADDIKEMKGNFVTQAEFWPVKVLVYGCTGLMLTAVIGALLLLILNNHAV